MSSLREKVFDHYKVDTPEGRRLPCWCDTCQGQVLFNPATTPWEAAHRIHRAWDGDDSVENVRPAIKAHHRAETHGRDQTEIADGKRKGLKHFGVKERKSSFYRPPGAKYDWTRGGYSK